MRMQSNSRQIRLGAKNATQKHEYRSETTSLQLARPWRSGVSQRLLRPDVTLGGSALEPHHRIRLRVVDATTVAVAAGEVVLRVLVTLLSSQAEETHPLRG